MEWSQGHPDNDAAQSVFSQERLPTELLSYIFLLSFPGQVKLPPRRHLSPLLPCHVCSWWRRVAMGTTSLWCNVHLVVPASSPNALGDLLVEWFARAGGSCNFSFKISVDHFTPKSLPYYQVVVQRFIIPYASRFKHLDLKGPVQALDMIIGLSAPVFSSIESLSLGQASNQIYPRMPDKPFITFRNSTRLREVVLGPIYSCRSFMDQIHLPWLQLTKLDFGGTKASPSTCHAILRQCQNLRECSLPVLTISPLQGTTSGSTCPLHLKDIHSLTFRASLHEATLAQLLQPLEFPRLQSLAVNSDHNSAWAHHAYMRLIRDSTCSLSSLTLINTYLDPTQLFEVLDLSPSLQELYLGRMSHYHRSRLSRNVIAGIAEGVLLPRLRVLVARLTSSLDDALEMVEKRVGDSAQRNDVSKLAKVVLGCDSPDTLAPGLLDRVGGIKEKGVDMELVPLSGTIPDSSFMTFDV